MKWEFARTAMWDRLRSRDREPPVINISNVNHITVWGSSSRLSDPIEVSPVDGEVETE